MKHLTLQLLGATVITLDDKPIKQLSTRAAEALVIYILHQSRPVPREQLADMFFQASEPKQAAANLRAMLSQIKKRLDPFIEITRYTVARREGVGFSADSIEFSEQLTVGSEQLTVEELRSTLELYRGDFLAGFHLRDAPEFEQWALVERERLRLLAINGLQQLIELQEERGAFVEVLQSAERLLAIEPLLESVHRTKMLMLARTGQRALALRHFAVAEQFFVDELGIELSGASVTLQQRILDLPDPLPHNLPPAKTSFVGRERELRELRERIAQPTQRLFTVLGMGGIGKTRFSQQLAHQLYATGQFLEGVFWIELAGMQDADELPVALANQLDVRLRGRDDPLDQLIAAIETSELLVILDNFEQLVGAKSAEILSRLLHAVPTLKLLVTSRERLNLYEEIVFNLDGLPVDAVEMEPSQAMTLFMRHAQRQQIGLQFDNDSYAAIDDICRQVEGVPLALELAAGLIDRLTPHAIAEQMRANFDLLATRYHNMPQRQRSVRAVFDYSWGLLLENERETLAMLSLFIGRFSPTAALAITQTSLTMLHALVDQSLLQRDDEGNYTIHPLIGQFAVAQLAAEQRTPTMHRFAAHYLALLQELDQIDYWPTFTERLPELRFASENMQQAWQWLLSDVIKTENPERMSMLDQKRRPLRSYFLATSQIYAGHLLFKAAHEKLQAAGWGDGSAEQQRLFAKIAIHAVDLGRIIGDHASAVQVGERYIALLEEERAYDDLHSALLMLKESYFYTGRSADAQAIFPKLERVVYQTERDELVGSLELERAHLAREAGKHDEALRYYRRALTYLEPLQNPRYMAIAYDYMGAIFYVQDEMQEAIAHQEKALTYAQNGNLAYTEAVILQNLPLSYAAVGEYDKAMATLQRGQEMMRRMNQQHMMVVGDRTMTDLLLSQEAWVDAAIALQAAFERANELNSERVTARLLARLPLLLTVFDQHAAAYVISEHLRDEAFDKYDSVWLDAGRERLGEFDAESSTLPSVEEVVDWFLTEDFQR